MTPAYPHRPLAELLPSLVIANRDTPPVWWVVRCWRPQPDGLTASLRWTTRVARFLPGEAVAAVLAVSLTNEGDWVTVDRADDDRLALDGPTPNPRLHPRRTPRRAYDLDPDGSGDVGSAGPRH